MRKKKQDQQETVVPVPAAGSRITPVDIQQKEFRLAFRGYKERDVDAFLDEITEELALYVEENRRLRDGASGARPVVEAPPPAGGDSADATREAEDILTRAREEAERIVRDAETRAAAAGTTSGLGDHGAVAPFLNKEREFLQSLAGLVQGHAESVKVMVKAHRERTSPASAPPVRVPGSSPELPIEPPGAEPAPSPPDAAAVSETAEEEGGTTSAPSERPARSLRELFWGED